MSYQYQNKEKDQELISRFVSDFYKMFTETKYNLIALNKRYDNIEQCINNVLLLNSTQAFEEKDNNQNEFEIAPEDIKYINEILVEEQDKEEIIETHVNDLNIKRNKESQEIINNNLINDDREDEEKEYIPTGVKPEKKVGKYTEFLKFKQEKNKMRIALGQKKFEKQIKKSDKNKLIGNKRNRSSKRK